MMQQRNKFSVDSKIMIPPTLTGLPTELYGIIGSHLSKDDLPRVTGMSKKLQRGTTQAYLEKVCGQDLRLSEILDYIRSEPDRFGYLIVKGSPNRYNCETRFYTKVSLDSFYSKSKDLVSTNLGIHPFVEYEILELNRYGVPVEYSILQEVQSAIIEFISRNMDRHFSLTPQVDLRSLFAILQKRLSCVTRDPAYARKRTHQTLDSIYSIYKKDQIGVTWQRIISTFIMISYLHLNQKAFDIREPLFIVIRTESYREVLESPDRIQAELDDLDRQIDQWVALIHNVIDRL